MTTNYMISTREYKARMKLATQLGIQVFRLSEVMTLGSGRMKGQYGLPASKKSAEKAMLAYKRMSDETERVLLDYETELSRVQSGRTKLQISEGRCAICQRECHCGYSACAVCLDVYHHEVRDSFLKSLDSCEALRVIDGI